MITIKQVDLYKKFGGDADVFIRCATADEKSIMNDKHWSLIDSLLQDIHLIKNKLASDAFLRSTIDKLKETCDNENTIRALNDIANCNDE